MSDQEQFFAQDTADRNRLQAEIIKHILGPNSTNEERLDWVIKNGKAVSDIIDDPKHQEDIAELAMDGRYEEAAEKVVEIMGVNV